AGARSARRSWRLPALRRGRLPALRRERLDVRDELHEILLAEQSLVGGHDRLVAGDEVGLWAHDRLAQVGLVDDRAAAVLEPDGGPEQPGQHGTALPGAGGVARRASLCLEERLPGGDRRERRQGARLTALP